MQETADYAATSSQEQGSSSCAQGAVLVVTANCDMHHIAVTACGISPTCCHPYSNCYACHGGGVLTMLGAFRLQLFDPMDARVITRRLILACLLLSLAFAGGATESSAASDPGSSSALQAPTGAGLAAPYYAIGDFDGDQQPDLATVQSDPYTQRDSRYSIRLQLSFGTSSAIGFTAPFGGLLLSAKDVNGDSAIDLVVTTVVDHKLVMVLVNDGHGNFSVAEEGAFPELRAEGGCRVDAPLAPNCIQPPVLQSRCPWLGEGSNAARLNSPVPAQRFRLTKQQNSPRWRVGATSGRSPPTHSILL